MSSGHLDVCSSEPNTQSVLEIESSVTAEEVPHKSPEPLNEPQLQSSDDEMYILVSEEERQLQDSRLQLCQESLNGSRQHHEQWADKIVRRRMFALSRLRKLQRSRRERMKFYDDLKLFIVEKSDSTSTPGSESVFSNEGSVKQT